MIKRCLISIGILASLLGVALTLWAEDKPKQSAARADVVAGMVVPTYDDAGGLRRPRDYATWVFVGASLGLSYDDDNKQGDGQKHNDGVGYFHNVYMQPEAFAEYVRTGYFPDKTMFVMENYRPAQKESINRGGYFESELVGMEIAVKDYDRVELGWAYFNFTKPSGLADTAKAFPRGFCWDCHAEHGADDNVFTQFYPVIRRAREQAKNAKPGEADSAAGS